MAKRQTVKANRKPTIREAHNHCEARNDSHVDYCREPAHRVFRTKKGLGGVLFTCDRHARGRKGEIVVNHGGPVGGGWRSR